MWPQADTWPWVALLFLLLFVYLVATEIQSQDCADRLCYNTTSEPNLDDKSSAMIDKLVTTLRVNHSPVEWRKALLIGMIVSLVVIVVFNIPLTLCTFILLGLIVFIFVYFASTWTNWVWWRCHDTYIERQLIALRSKC